MEVPFIKPSFPSSKKIAKDYENILESNWFTNFGPQEQKFTKELKAFLGQELEVSTFSNATFAIIASIIALMGKGDGSKTVIMPAFTFVAGAQALIWCGYRPFFVDILPDTLQLDAEKAEAVISKKESSIAGILFCNTFGVGDPNIEKWEALSRKYNLPLIIDSAAGFGSRYSNGDYLGAKGNCEIFSFHATKPFAIGEGGGVSTRQKSLIKKLKIIQNFGFDSDRSASELGFNAKLQEINAAIGIRQLESFVSRLESRQETYLLYKELLAAQGYAFQSNAENSSLCFAAVVCESMSKKHSVLKVLNENGVQAREYYNPPIHRQHYFVANTNLWSAAELDVTDDICGKILSLPIHDNMLEETVREICGKIYKA